jgi:cell division protein FtsW (lipid II flippase)
MLQPDMGTSLVFIALILPMLIGQDFQTMFYLSLLRLLFAQSGDFRNVVLYRRCSPGSVWAISFQKKYSGFIYCALCVHNGGAIGKHGLQ